MLAAFIRRPSSTPESPVKIPAGPCGQSPDLRRHVLTAQATATRRTSPRGGPWNPRHGRHGSRKRDGSPFV